MTFILHCCIPACPAVTRDEQYNMKCGGILVSSKAAMHHLSSNGFTFYILHFPLVTFGGHWSLARLGTSYTGQCLHCLMAIPILMTALCGAAA